MCTCILISAPAICLKTSVLGLASKFQALALALRVEALVLTTSLSNKGYYVFVSSVLSKVM